MLSLESLKRQAVEWQTSLMNVSREYVQHLFLSHLYSLPESEALAFKGGTALRLLYGSPRFSEDLDFTGHMKPFHLAPWLAKTASLMKGEALTFRTIEAKATSGGYLALYECRVHEETIRLELNISLRGRAPSEAILVASPLVPAYQCLRLTPKAMVTEKIQALLSRKKPRDFFDLYFLLRQRLAIEALIPFKKRLVEEIQQLEARAIERELKLFLPVRHHRTIADLPKVLEQELLRL
jgi:predicted nucleotidyltransferase component of viral defense system